MITNKTIIILTLSAVFLLPTGLFADDHPTGQPVVSTTDADKVAPVAASNQESPKAAEPAAATAPKPDAQAAKDTVAAPSEFIHSYDTTILPPAHPAVSVARPLAIEVPATALDRNILTPATPDNADVKGPIEKNIHMYTSGLKEHFSTWLARSGKYLGLMKSIFRENYMPEELVFLSLIESGFNPKAYSWAKASGPWQFLKGTGKKYGLRIDRYVDERRDPVKSTRAAAAYLKDLYDIFGTWSLAMASYNAGEGNVARAVNHGGTLDFWALRKTRTLPQETEEYVPKFLAAKMIAQNPGLFGFDGLEYEQPFVFDEVVVKKTVALKRVAKCCGVSVDEIKELNPELIRSCTPPNNPHYTLRIPKGTKETFMANYDGRPDKVEEGYVVRRGDTLKKIARKFGTTKSAICDANGIRRLRVGQRLEIPVADTLSSKAPSNPPVLAKTDEAVLAKTGVGNAEGAPETTNLTNGQEAANSTYKVRKCGSPVQAVSPVKKTYRVKRGDTLWAIAQKFGVTVEDLVKTNSMGRRARIRVGQRLVIPTEEAA